MIIYKTRYQAIKNKNDKNDVVVKVDAGGGETGYVVMTAATYKTWRNQK